MATDDRVKVLEDEFKLIKSELRQTLSSVRDFLLDIKLPPMQDDPEAIKKLMPPTGGSGGGGPSSASASAGAGSQSSGSMPELTQQPESIQPAENVEPEMVEPEPELEPETVEPEDTASVEETNDDLDSESEDLQDIDAEDTGISAGDLPTDEKPETSQPEKGANVMRMEETGARTPQVNLLANLVRWVSRSKKEIGPAQLPIFLDVYATTGNLSPEMKDIIIRLAEVATDPVSDTDNLDASHLFNEELAICMEINGLAGQLPEEIRPKIKHLADLILKQVAFANKADMWSQMLLELHGILTGGGSTLLPLQPLNKDEAKKEEPSADTDNPDDASRADLNEEETEVKAEDETETDLSEVEEVPPQVLKGTRPARLRLIMPVGDGAEQELDLGNLFIATDSQSKRGNGHTNTIVPKR